MSKDRRVLGLVNKKVMDVGEHQFLPAHLSMWASCLPTCNMAALLLVFHSHSPEAKSLDK